MIAGEKLQLSTDSYGPNFSKATNFSNRNPPPKPLEQTTFLDYRTA